MIRVEEQVPRGITEGRKLPNGHGDFVAGVATGTVDAVLQGFVGQCLMVDEAEVEVLEEFGNASEEADALDVACFGLIEERVEEQATGSVSLGAGADNDRAKFGKVLAVDVEGGTTDELARSCFNDGEGADVRANLRVTARQQGAVVSEAVD